MIMIFNVDLCYFWTFKSVVCVDSKGSASENNFGAMNLFSQYIVKGAIEITIEEVKIKK